MDFSLISLRVVMGFDPVALSARTRLSTCLGDSSEALGFLRGWSHENVGDLGCRGHAQLMEDEIGYFFWL